MNTAVAFGKFDSLHIGHRAVLERLKTYRYPVAVCLNDNEGEVVYSPEEKRYGLEKMGIKAVFDMPVSAYLEMGLEKFVYEILYRRVGASEIIVGENFENLAKLKEEAGKFEIRVDVVEDIKVNVEAVKKTLQEGDFQDALMLLGDNYLICGDVVHGKSSGSKHGMPTANIQWAENKIYPRFGVYATKVNVGGKQYKGVTNIGLRPSDDNIPIPTCETLILDFDEKIYGKTVVLEVFKYIRPVIKFRNLDELREQIKKDAASVFPESC